MNNNYKPNQGLTLGAIETLLSLNKEFQETFGDVKWVNFLMQPLIL